MSGHDTQAEAAYTDLYVGGVWIKADGPSAVTVQCSATGERLGRFPVATEADIDRAVDAAKRARADPSGWSAWSADERALAMEKTRRGDRTTRRADGSTHCPGGRHPD
jgi:acyl-CoA reductase-like NAD-dependent aldehyde dehydrogenase